ncbi:alpha/beta-Hydrolases superfamily protein [Rhynchospora pubera]|uniref:Alpha/beta-Hydrolases superfamily protein n=1 Tax=Rhynchospora pubera TaxID=906938 RepID=A0AAV8H2P3_9POAL|nr:alpha/beta-Hydrolases superfamily protein [Rhynchospora pubera]KAJ4810984.1 alpha/beta-Hydrolases superfamily protein [Rhynchospora pubera]
MLTHFLALFLVAVTGGGAHNFIINQPPPLIDSFHVGSPITSPHIRLRDGRHLAYREYGVPKEKAKYKIVVVHGFDSSKNETFPVSKDLVQELGICFVAFDRAGYGDSNPHPTRTVMSESMDIDELAYQLKLGPKFYLIGTSMGGYSAYSCLKYIPQRLSGVVLLVPAVNYWWPSLPADVSESAFKKLSIMNQQSFWVAHNLPFLFCGWMKQNFFKTSPAITGIGVPETTCKPDLEIINQNQSPVNGTDAVESKSTNDAVYESLCRDVMVVFSNWEFDPLQMENPFPNDEASVHLWSNVQDEMCQIEIQRHVAKKLPWVRYHETPYGGHNFFNNDGWGDKIIKTLLLGDGEVNTQVHT